MGTRHLVGVLLDGTFKVAQYGQSDGYPGGAGIDVLRFCTSVNMRDFAKAVRKVRFTTETDEECIEGRWSALNTKHGVDYDAFYAGPYQALSSYLGSAVLPLLMAGEVTFLYNNSKFGAEGSQCEWAWIINLDTMQLECYNGLHEETPQRGYWIGQRDPTDRYGAVHLMRIFPLDNLPSNTDFLNSLAIQ